MYGPGTTAAAQGAAGFEAEPPLQAVTAGAVAASSATAPPTLAARAISPQVNGAAVPVSGETFDLPCTADPDLFFAESPADVEDAKALCHGCRARHACLAGALERREPWGVWGGELLLRGEIVPRKRPRGRPRKTEIAA